MFAPDRSSSWRRAADRPVSPATRRTCGSPCLVPNLLTLNGLQTIRLREGLNSFRITSFADPADSYASNSFIIFAFYALRKKHGGVPHALQIHDHSLDTDFLPFHKKNFPASNRHHDSAKALPRLQFA